MKLSLESFTKMFAPSLDPYKFIVTFLHLALGFLCLSVLLKVAALADNGFVIRVFLYVGIAGLLFFVFRGFRSVGHSLPAFWAHRYILLMHHSRSARSGAMAVAKKPCQPSQKIANKLFSLENIRPAQNLPHRQDKEMRT